MTWHKGCQGINSSCPVPGVQYVPINCRGSIAFAETTIGFLIKAGWGICRITYTPTTTYPARQDSSIRTGDYWFPSEEPRQLQRMHGLKGPHLTQKGISIMNDPLQATPAAPTLPALPVTRQVEPHTKGGVSDSEAATLAKWTGEDLAIGKISSE